MGADVSVKALCYDSLLTTAKCRQKKNCLMIRPGNVSNAIHPAGKWETNTLCPDSAMLFSLWYVLSCVNDLPDASKMNVGVAQHQVRTGIVNSKPDVSPDKFLSSFGLPQVGLC